ncbi:MAG: phosphoribosylformylglycinamidine cyclo-ligase, partial [Myxococcales bacterium]|nr:phosphoribosylformylglycinamidine cyclo-ligase [Myxococcales bacterium]
ARPLFFLDYFATGALSPAQGEAVVRGIAEGCRQAGCALLGGETAEMPGFYAPGHYDLAGFAVGVVERAELIDGTQVTPGDVLIGLPSSGLHSNGYSLARKVLPWRDEPALAEVLLTPTRIYARAVATLRAAGPVHALAHITGGGLPGNLPRVLPPGVGARIDGAAWTRPPIFQRIAQEGPVAEAELRRAFNLGVGLVAVVPAAAAADHLAALAAQGEAPFIMGAVVPGEGLDWP